MPRKQRRSANRYGFEARDVVVQVELRQRIG